MMDELKPCPFCGGEAEFDVRETKHGEIIFVSCTMCDASSKAFKFHGDADYFESRAANKAAHFWNSREEKGVS